jgi:unsaturated rhamnogalacturonyl hydrolase
MDCPKIKTNMMKRRQFITTATLAVPIVTTGIVSCINKDYNITESKTSLPGLLGDPLIEKAITAMLCMQRMAWEQGTASQALIAVGRNNLAILFAKDAVLRQTQDGRLGIVGNDSGVTDPASNGESVLLAYKETGDEKFKLAADAMYGYLKNKAPKSSDGVLQHLNNATQVWSDSSFMAPPFLALMGDYDEAVKQIEGLRKYLMEPARKLYYHMWDVKKHEYARKLFWGGGNGWTAAGIAKIINVLPGNRNDLRNKMTMYGQEVIDGCIAYMRPDGLFHDIIDDSSSFVETNLSQMLAFAVYTGIKAGWLNQSYKEKADIMRLAARAKIDDYGIVQGACGSPHFNKSGTSTEAQSFFLMMESAFHSL